MRIVIVGDGKIGSALAEQLSREGHEITIVDRSGTPLQRTVEDLDILSVEGNGATYATQIEAGVDEADLVIAVTAQDELNLLCCLVAKKIGARHTIARVRNPEYAGELSLISDDLGLSLSVNPELICATEMARTLRTPSAIKTDTFFGGKVELLKFQLPADSPLSGKTLMELPSVTKAKVLVCAVERGEQEIHIPSGGFRLQSGDRISFVASYGGAQQFFRHQIQPRDAAVSRQGGQKRIRELFRAGGFAADAAVDKQNVFHWPLSCSSRYSASRATRISFCSPRAVRLSPST